MTSAIVHKAIILKKMSAVSRSKLISIFSVMRLSNVKTFINSRT